MCIRDSPDGDHLAAARVCAGDGGDRRRWNLEALGVHAVLCDGVDAHRLKGAGADMQRQPGGLDATLTKLREQGVVEMQAGSRRRNSAWMAGKYGLITLFVVAAGGVGDIGG